MIHGRKGEKLESRECEGDTFIHISRVICAEKCTSRDGKLELYPSDIYTNVNTSLDSRFYGGEPWMGGR